MGETFEPLPTMAALANRDPVSGKVTPPLRVEAEEGQDALDADRWVCTVAPVSFGPEPMTDPSSASA